jgi:paraquat-inducible protein A
MDVAAAGGLAPEPEAPKALSAVRNVLLSFLIILATVFFALGIILPSIRFTTVYVWTAEHSIASGPFTGATNISCAQWCSPSRSSFRS